LTAEVILTHLSLVIAALVFAVAAGIPLGVVCYFYPSARRVILRIVDFIQTTPALALLGIIMITPLGAGKPTVIVGLALYSLLPIVRNTCLGLDQVPPYLIEAGEGMGMTRFYRLVHVELPLAAPIIFTGIRIAAVNAIGTAVFASFVGGGGLGSFITTAIRQRDMAIILLGTGLLMAMALILDLIMALAEHYLNKRTSSRSAASRTTARVGGCLGCLMALVLCIYAFLPSGGRGLVLYQGEFSEVQLVNSMIKQLVEQRHPDLPVTIKDQMTAKNNFTELSGEGHTCDLMYTWDGTLLTTIMGLDTADIPEGITLYDFVQERLGEKYDMRMLGKIGVNNTYAIGVTQEVMDTYHPETISDLVPIAGELRFGAEQDFFTSAGSMKYEPFVARYGLEFKEAVHVDIMMKYTMVEEGAYEVMVVYATDGLNRRANLTVLEDDMHFFPDYYGTILVREDVFQRFADVAPGLEETLTLLNGQFTNEIMSELTYRVDVLGEDVDAVAADYLRTIGLLS
jgi:osmoprotectant transport system permease protein